MDADDEATELMRQIRISESEAWIDLRLGFGLDAFGTRRRFGRTATLSLWVDQFNIAFCMEMAKEEGEANRKEKKAKKKLRREQKRSQAKENDDRRRKTNDRPRSRRKRTEGRDGRTK
jgi:hypothetical protein